MMVASGAMPTVPRFGERVVQMADAECVARLVEVERLARDERDRVRDVEARRDVDMSAADAAVEHGDARTGAAGTAVPRGRRMHRVRRPLNPAEGLGIAERGVGSHGDFFGHLTRVHDAIRLDPLHVDVLIYRRHALDLAGAHREVGVTGGREGNADLGKARRHRTAGGCYLRIEISRELRTGEVDDVGLGVGGWSDKLQRGTAGRRHAGRACRGADRGVLDACRGDNRASHGSGS